MVLGGAIFLLWVRPPRDEALRSCRRLLWWSAAALAAVQACYVAADSAILAGTTGLRLRELAGANFFIAGTVAICAALALAAATTARGGRSASAIVIPAALLMG